VHPTQSDTLRNLPPYVFAELDRLKAEARARGATLVDLGIGSPNIPVAPGIIRAMAAAGEEPTSGAYPPFRATPGYFDAIADFMHARFGATIEPEAESLALSGAK
jgi:LL-diaminopimelate aminotransferase